MDEEKENNVRLVGIDVPFWDLVFFLVKFVIASIPAAIILTLIVSMLSAIWVAIAAVIR